MHAIEGENKFSLRFDMFLSFVARRLHGACRYVWNLPRDCHSERSFQTKHQFFSTATIDLYQWFCDAIDVCFPKGSRKSWSAIEIGPRNDYSWWLAMTIFAISNRLEWEEQREQAVVKIPNIMFNKNL